MERLDVRVRGYRARDLDDLMELHDGPAAIAGTLQLPFRGEPELRERYGRSGADRHTLVAVIEDDGRERAVGVADLQVYRLRRSHAAGLGMFVNDAWSGRGIGSALMTHLTELADTWLGLERIELSVFHDNEAALALYGKFGFEVEGRHVNFARRGGEYVDTIAMARLRPR
jgi:putative acetyltransferase